MIKQGLSRFIMLFAIAFTLSTLFTCRSANAYYDYRFALGVGIAELNNSSETDLEVGAEFEYRIDALWGVGAFGNYIFSSPGISLMGVPEVFVHPLGGDWYINASPLLEIGSGIGTHVGVRVGTRVPIPLGVISLIPQVAVDFIDGQRNLILGFGIQI